MQIRNNFLHCIQIALSQARQSLELIPVLEYPFQHVCVDAFEMYVHQYLVITDRYSGWIVVFLDRTHNQRTS